MIQWKGRIWNKTAGAFYSQATVKRLGQNNWCAYVPGETPSRWLYFLRGYLEKFYRQNQTVATGRENGL